ncbi:MAG: hypothetical protein COT84_04590 [Chlamydiae bacterium CG10_big_fil_rev_8_21_14_0_10_35_9]|nr:MAG: hypothetical protein COT84_04590 [Chlamydiae bacterium CG10_big_fil_rev_8_21_14_0_10_35_9]
MIRKRILYLLLTVFICIASVFFLYSKKAAVFPTQTTCAFCNEQILRRQKFYEDELVMALYTHKPIVPSHFLIIPKRHVKRLEMLSEEEVVRVYQVIQKVNRASHKVFQTTSYFIHQKNGKEVGQSVPHVHFHYISKQPKDSSSFIFLVKMIIAYLSPPLSSEKMQQATKKMQAAMESEMTLLQ